MAALAKTKQLWSQSARSAIRAFQLREFPERHELTEKSFLARVEGRPNDEDLVVPLHIGWGREDSNRWAVMCKGLVLAKKGSVIFRNEVDNTLQNSEEEVEGDRFAFNLRGMVDDEGKFTRLADQVEAMSKWPTKLEKLVKFANPDADVMDDMKTSALDELGRLQHVFLFDNRAVGASQFGAVHTHFLTNCKSTARVLGEMLSQVPVSRAVRARKENLAVTLTHCAYRDPEVPDIDTYAAYDASQVVARGQFEPKEMLEILALLAAKKLAGSDTLVLRGSATRDATGEVTLVLGETKEDASGLQAAHHVIWGPEGLTRAWDGVLKSDRTVVPLPDAVTLLPHPSKVVVSKGLGSDLKVALEKVGIVGVEVGVSVPLFEKMVKDHGVSVSLGK